MSRITRATVVVAAVVVGVVSASATAGAAARTRAPHRVHARTAEVYTCGRMGEARGHYFDGFGQPYGTGSYEGAYAAIVTRYGAVCDTDTSASNFVAVWSMIASSRAAGGYAQSGYLRSYGTCDHYFTQTAETSTAHPYTFIGTSGCLAAGATNNYGQRFETTGCPDTAGCLYSRVDGNVWDRTTWDPRTAWGAPPWSPEFYGEAGWLENDMPGNISTPTTFSDIQGQSQSTNGFVGYPCGSLAKGNALSGKTRADGESWYDRPTACPGFNIFTDRAGL